LSAGAGAKLMELRKRVAITFREELGLDVGFEKQVTQINYMKPTKDIVETSITGYQETLGKN